MGKAPAFLLNTFPPRRGTPRNETGPGVSTAKSSKAGIDQWSAASTEHWIFNRMFIVLRMVYTTMTRAALGTSVARCPCAGMVISSAGLRTGERDYGLAATWIPTRVSAGVSPVENFRKRIRS